MWVIQSLAKSKLILFCISVSVWSDPIEKAIISPDGKYFARSTASGTTVYEVPTGKIVKELKGVAALNLKFSNDSRYLAIGQLTNLTLWDLTKKEPLASWKGNNRWSFIMDFSPDSSLLAARDDNFLHIWEIATQKLLLTISMPYEMYGLTFSPDGRFIAVGGTEYKAKEEESRFHEIKIWEIPTGKLHMVLKGPEYCIIKSLAFSPDGYYIATGLSVPLARLWDLRTKKELWNRQVDNWNQRVDNIDYGILTFSTNGKQLFIGGFQTVTVLDSANGTVIKQHTIPTLPGRDRITSLMAKPGHLIVTTNYSVLSIDLTSDEQQTLLNIPRQIPPRIKVLVQENISEQELEQAKKQWKTNFSAFLKLSIEAIKKGAVPHEEELESRLDDLVGLTDGAGYIIDTLAPEGTCQAEFDEIFPGNEIEWEVTLLHNAVTASYWDDPLMEIKAKLDPKTPLQCVWFEIPKIKPLPKAGERLRIRGILERPKKESICRMSGVGVLYYCGNKANRVGIYINMPIAIVEPITK
ncbi:MAG: hypothetical protein AB1390_11015 [Nitrospirota bacterium]